MAANPNTASARASGADDCDCWSGFAALFDHVADLWRRRGDSGNRDDYRSGLHCASGQRVTAAIAEYLCDPMAHIWRGATVAVRQPEREWEWG